MKALLTFLVCLSLAWAQDFTGVSCPGPDDIPSPADCTQQCTNHFNCLIGTAAGNAGLICCEGCCVQPVIPTGVEGCTYEDSTIAVGDVLEDGCLVCACLTAGGEAECTDQQCPVIGFEVTSHTVTEGVDSAVELCATVQRGNVTRAITVRFFTIDGSATEPEDYQQTTSVLTFDPENSRRCEEVPIMDDTLVEDAEAFFGAIELIDTSASGSSNRVTVNPPETAVNIYSDDDPVICTFGGQQYEPGDTFPAGDGCNTCSCSPNGVPLCTLIACPANVTCTYRDRQYEVGDSFPAGDGCNTCTCGDDGTVACTEIACPTCPEGKVYQACGTACPLTCDNYNDQPLVCTLQCESGCFCPNELVENGDDCVDPSQCPAVFCEYQDFRYEPGDTFPAGDGCNTCFCGDDGTVACTEIGCPTPCPPGVPIALCFARPCDVNRCPAYPEATCEDDYCGGCNARFFSADGNEVTDSCGDDVCPDDQPLAACLVNPCEFARCPAFPEAECEPDFCGGCNAKFFLDGNEVTDSCGPEINRTCPAPDTGLIGTCQHECNSTEDCREGRRCCFNGCGRVCLEPVEQSCSYDDRRVPVGESFVARDGCTTCTCISAGNLVCARDLCPANVTCTYRDMQYEVGDSFPAEDGCNTCICSNSGQAVCTLIPCISCATILCTPGFICRDFGSQGYCEPTCDPPFYHCGDEQRCVLVNGSCDTAVGPCPREVRCEDIDECELIICAVPFCGPNEPITDDENCCPYCPPCPDDVPIVNCFADPCQVTECPLHPDAICYSDFCGGCNARFFYPDGEEVTETCRDICILPADPGPCDAAFPSYFFNSETGRCEEFVYGGCQGNRNRFETVEACLRRCNSDSVCLLRPEPGPCDANFPSYFYNATSAQCEEFAYGGCEGNRNRFNSSLQCYRTCSFDPCALILCDLPDCGPGIEPIFSSDSCCPYCPEPTCPPDRPPVLCLVDPCSVAECPAYPDARCESDSCGECKARFYVDGDEVTDSCTVDVCSLPADPGPCEAIFPSYFFNSETGRCEEFDYGGCQGNRNRFETLRECLRFCVPDLCSLPADPGPCDSVVPSYFFNPETERCEAFNYGGCDGNLNRFETRRACLYHCDPDSPCLLEPDPSLCFAYFPSFFYNITSEQCEVFIYGGCRGNDNRFETASECWRACDPEGEPPTAPTEIPCELVRCENPNCPGGVEPVMDDEQCCPYCPEPTCPPDLPQVLCFADPCTVGVCPLYPDARCVSDYCGGCNARFYDEDGEEVTELCVSECPDDQLEVQCLLDPCTFASCPAFPEAECIPDYCGGCNARFYEDGEDVTAACEVDLPPSPTEFLACPAVAPDTLGVCVEACSAHSDCDEDDRCCFNGCGRTCQGGVPTQIPYYEPLLECPSLSAQVGVCFSECQRDSDCDEDQLCCSNGCGQLCVRGQPSRPICSALRRRILSFQEDGAVGAYVPQCQDDGSFAPVQCHASTGYCWCVHTETGEPMSTSPAPPGTNLQCQSCRYNGQTFYPGDSFPAEDGCNECGCSDNGQVFCTLRACVDPCSLPPDAGPCRAYFPAYYYNATVGKCQQFIYGGCEGNENKFLSNRDCLRQCQPDSFCLLSQDPGRCDDSTVAGSDSDASGEPSYFYNTTSGQCEFFLYGGCGGNENRFGDTMECLRTCDPDNIGPTDSTGQPCLLIQCDIPNCPSGSEVIVDDTSCCPYCEPLTECSSDEKRCNDDTCIPLSYVCDGLADCPQGEDEPDGCDPEIIPCEFRCGSDANDDDSDESCIPESYVCDRFLDCPGGEDEMSCVTPISDIPYYEPPLQCPDSAGQLAACVEECRSNSDCDEDELCCPGACSGGICSRGVPVTPACPAVRELYANRSSALYVPQCEPDGGFSPVQCHASTGCWCVNVQTGVPTSVATPVSDGDPRCNVCEYEGEGYAVGESFTAEDGCNTCVCTANGVLCTLVACTPAPCRVGDREVRHGGTLEDDCSECSCLFGQLECRRKPCVVEPEALTAVTQVTLPFDGDFNAITATDDSREEFEREVRRTMVRTYRAAHGLMESQIQDIELRSGSIIVIVYFTESEDQMQGANVTILVSQMGQDYESGMLIIRYDNGVLQPNGEFSTSVNVPTEEEEGEGLLWWHILLVVVGALLVAGLVVVLAVVIIHQRHKKAEWKLACRYSSSSSPENAYENAMAIYPNDEALELQAPSDYMEPIKA